MLKLLWLYFSLWTRCIVQNRRTVFSDWALTCGSASSLVVYCSSTVNSDLEYVLSATHGHCSKVSGISDTETVKICNKMNESIKDWRFNIHSWQVRYIWCQISTWSRHSSKQIAWFLTDGIEWVQTKPNRLGVILMPTPDLTSRRSLVRPFACLAVAKVVNTIPWKTYLFWCQVIYWTTPWNGQLWGSGGQTSRSHEAGEDRFGSLVEA